MKNTARNKQIVFFAESRKTAKFKLFLEKAKKGHSGEFSDIQGLESRSNCSCHVRKIVRLKVKPMIEKIVKYSLFFLF